MNFICKLFGGRYDNLWKAIIRPTRDIYENFELGPSKFEINGKCYKRTDLEILNNRGLKLMSSFWEPFDEEREKLEMPCVIYLHGNSSSRCEAYSLLNFLLPKNICIFSFDFSGCGKSEGEYISLGYYEKEDVHSVVEFLQKSKKVSKIALWGRSMGAVTAIMYARKHPSNISALILDSAFYSFNSLIHEIVDSKITLPNFIVDRLYRTIKDTIREKAKFNLDFLETFTYARECVTPAFFCHGKNDSFVLLHHCIDLFNDYKGKKKYFLLVDGNHNSPRPNEFKNKACIFLHRYLKDDFKIKKAINCQNVIFNNNNIIVNYSDINNINNINDGRENNFYRTFQKMNYNPRSNSNDTVINIFKYSLISTSEQSVGKINKEKFIYNKKNKISSQNLKAQPLNKYPTNEPKIKRSNTLNNNSNIMNIKTMKINDNKFEESSNIINNSSSILDITPSELNYLNDLNNVPDEDIKINRPRARSVSVDISSINRNSIKRSNSLTVNKNMIILSRKKSVNYDQPLSKNMLINDLIKGNKHKNKNNYQTENNKEKDYVDRFFNNKKPDTNNLNNFVTKNMIHFNNFKKKDILEKKEDKKIIYESKRPIDKENDLFRKKAKKIETKLKREEVRHNIALKSVNPLNEDNKSVNITENTMLDENEEAIGRKLPQ